MSPIEQTILEKIRQMDEVRQQQVLAFILDMQPVSFDFDQWWAEVQAFQSQLQPPPYARES